MRIPVHLFQFHSSTAKKNVSRSRCRLTMEAMQQLFEKLTSAEGRLDQGKLSEHKSDIAAVRTLPALMRRHLASWFHSPRWCFM